MSHNGNIGNLDGPHPMVGHLEPRPTITEHAAETGRRVYDTLSWLGSTAAHTVTKLIQVLPEFHPHV